MLEIWGIEIVSPKGAQLLGGFLISAAYVPQILRIFQTRSSRDVSLGFLWLILFALILMSIYSIDLYVQEGLGVPLLVTNILNLIMVVITLIVAYKFRNN